jgi:hypothetical protein
MKNLTAYGLAALLFVFSSCQKDYVSEPSSVTGDVTSSNTAADDVLETALPCPHAATDCNQF